jgi:hypothetical protein
MAHDPDERDLGRLWREQKEGGPPMSLAEIRARSHRFERQIRVRNLAEYVAGAFVVFWFARMILADLDLATRAPIDTWTRIGAALLVAGTCYVMYQIHRRGSASSLPGDLGLTSCVEFHRTALVRQRDALAGVKTWYLLPFVPGLVTIFVAGLFAGTERRLPAILGFVITALVFAAIAHANARAARTLQREIDALDEKNR